jgi:hypothetical protein
MSFEFILPFLRPTEPFFAGPQTVRVRGQATPAVIAASWGATDASTQQLMDSFYDSLNQGTIPDVALRNALSPCSIPTDNFASLLLGSMLTPCGISGITLPFSNRAPLVLPDRVPSSVRAIF